jgi:lysozyme family protein
MSFQRAVANVLKNEGGLVDNPNDPGGLTNFGISQRAYPSLDIRNLTSLQAMALYHKDYWTPIHGDELPDPVSFALLDYAANSGVHGAIAGLQRALGLAPDGVMGPQTIAACQRSGVVTALSVQRLYSLTGDANWEDFGKGWATRVIGTAIAAFQA